MKKILALLLAASVLLSMTACGGSAAPAETASETTQPALRVTEAPAETPTESAMTAFTGAEECLDALSELGYIEFNSDLYAKQMERFYGVTDASVTPASMELTEYGFTMELDCMLYFETAKEVRQVAPWTTYGTKGEELGVFLDLESQGYELYDTSDLSGWDDASDVCRIADFTYYLVGEDGKAESMAYVTAAYYPGSGNLYNVVQEFTEQPEEMNTANVLARTAGEYRGVNEVETLQYGEFSFELHTFAIQCGEKVSLYQFRPGMSFSDWACSELNTDGWIPWYGDEVLSPDRAYSFSSGYLDMQEEMELLGMGNLVTAEPYDGSTNYLNNDYIGGVEYGAVTPIAPNGAAGGQVTGVDITGMSEEELRQYLAEQYGIDPNMPIAVIKPPEGSLDGAPTKDDVADMMQTEEGEIAMNGNISVPVAHMVNARTPLFTPGFRIVSKENGRAAYHSTEMTTGLLLDDIIDIYMNGVADELIPHIKLYAFPESEAFMKSLEGHTILNVHPTPFEQGNEMLTIPDNAVCLTFERVPDGKEAPNSPNPLKPGHENLNKDAVYARYATKEDPNFGKGVNLVFAITFDEELVYWIHMGANFYEIYNGESISGGMRY